MHAPDTTLDGADPGRLASFADVLAGELPGAWTRTYHPPEAKDGLAELADSVWDMNLVAESLAAGPLRQAAVLTRADGARLAVINRNDKQDGFLVAAIAPANLPPEAFRGIREPDGIALSDDPFQAAETIAVDLLARYDAALAQVRHNAAALSGEPDAVNPSQADRVVLTWQGDGSLAATPADSTAVTILLAHGFVPDERADVLRLNGDDTAVQARAVHSTGSELARHGITTALQYPSARPAVTPAAPAGPPARTGATTARTR